MVQKRKSGWQPDLPDQRDLIFAASGTLLRKLPAKVDLSHLCPPVYEQDWLGSCTANAIGAAFQFGLMKQKTADAFMPSRLFIYYNERVLENTVPIDNGAQLRTGIKTVHKLGVCQEDMHPYKPFDFKKKPSKKCFTEALNHQVLSYHRVRRNLNQLKGCLAEGYPFVFGFTMYESFESTEVKASGVLNMPERDEARAGGHAAMAVGYNEASKRFIVRNSFGEDWGNKGYFTMPYEYLLNDNLSDDFWTIRLVELTAEEKVQAPKVKKAREKARRK